MNSGCVVACMTVLVLRMVLFLEFCESGPVVCVCLVYCEVVCFCRFMGSIRVSLL